MVNIYCRQNQPLVLKNKQLVSLVTFYYKIIIFLFSQICFPFPIVIHSFSFFFFLDFICLLFFTISSSFLSLLIFSEFLLSFSFFSLPFSSSSSFFTFLYFLHHSSSSSFFLSFFYSIFFLFFFFLPFVFFSTQVNLYFFVCSSVSSSNLSETQNRNTRPSVDRTTFLPSSEAPIDKPICRWWASV